MAPLKKHPLYSWLSIGVGITSLVTAMIFVMMAYRTGGRIVRPAVHAPYNRWIAGHMRLCLRERAPYCFTWRGAGPEAKL
jgi:hypothetical protein